MKNTREELVKIHSWDYVKSFSKSENWRISRWLKKYLTFNNDKILEVWCGSWLLTIELEKENIKSYLWVDFSKDFIDLANKNKIEKKLNRSNFIECDINIISKDYPNYFDKIFAIDFTEHVYDNDLNIILKSIYFSLNQWWEFIIHTPNLNFILELLKDKWILKQETWHIAVRDLYQYKKILQNIWFNDIRIFKIEHYINKLKLLHIFKSIPIIWKFFEARILIICKK